MRPVVRLWEGVGLGVIIEYPSGVLYSNQTGGTACRQPSVEGVFVPLRNDITDGVLLSPERELRHYFADGKYGGDGKYAGTGAVGGIDTDDVQFINTVLTKCALSEALSVDVSRLSESEEAWIPVVIAKDEGVFSGFGPYPKRGILTWPNSD
jgi:hypothetical protein